MNPWQLYFLSFFFSLFEYRIKKKIYYLCTHHYLWHPIHLHWPYWCWPTNWFCPAVLYELNAPWPMLLIMMATDGEIMWRRHNLKPLQCTHTLWIIEKLPFSQENNNALTPQKKKQQILFVSVCMCVWWWWWESSGSNHLDLYKFMRFTLSDDDNSVWGGYKQKDPQCCWQYERIRTKEKERQICK